MTIKFYKGPGLTPAQRAYVYASFVERSEFMKVEQITNLHPASLDNPILPVFKQANFPEADYNMLRQILRLASLCLKAGIQQEDSILVKIVNDSGQLVPLHEPFGDQDDEQYAFPQLPKGSAVEQEARRRRTFQELDRAATYVTFLPSDDVKNGGCTEYKAPPNSTVRYSRKQYDQIVNLTIYGSDPALLTVLRWEFAFTFAHELMHVLTNAQDYNGLEVYNEIYYSPDKAEAAIAEVGFEFEARLLGGWKLEKLYAQDVKKKAERLLRHQYPDGTYSAFQGVMVIWEWPYRGVVEHYKDNGYPMGQRFRSGLCPGDIDVAYRVSIQFISRYFDKDFWAQKVGGEEGLAALQPPRDVGHCFTAMDGIIQPRMSTVVRPLPAGYMFGPRHDIVRIPKQADPSSVPSVNNVSDPDVLVDDPDRITLDRESLDDEGDAEMEDDTEDITPGPRTPPQTLRSTPGAPKKSPQRRKR